MSAFEALVGAEAETVRPHIFVMFKICFQGASGGDMGMGGGGKAVSGGWDWPCASDGWGVAGGGTGTRDQIPSDLTHQQGHRTPHPLPVSPLLLDLSFNLPWI